MWCKLLIQDKRSVHRLFSHAANTAFHLWGVCPSEEQTAERSSGHAQIGSLPRYWCPTVSGTQSEREMFSSEEVWHCTNLPWFDSVEIQMQLPRIQGYSAIMRELVACDPLRIMTALWFSSATSLITFCGGLLALRLQAYRGVVFAFCAGALVAAALMEVVPEALELLEPTSNTFHHHHLLLACTLGFVFFYLFEHTTNHAEASDHESARSHVHHAGAMGAAGIIVHSFLDGVAIGQAFQAGEELGWAIAGGVLFHKLADGASVAGIMMGTQHSSSATTAMLFTAALAPIAGVLLQSVFVVPTPILALTLGWFAGVFLYLGASSLLPAAHATSDSPLVPLSMLSGVALIYLAQLLAH